MRPGPLSPIVPSDTDEKQYVTRLGKLQSTGPLAKKLAVHGTIFGQPAAHGTFRNFSAVHGTAPNFPAVHGTPPFWPPQPTGPLKISDSPRDRPKFPTVHGTAKNSDTHRTAQISDSPRDRPKFGAVHGTAPNFRQSTGPAVPERHDPRRRCSMLKHLVTYSLDPPLRELDRGRGSVLLASSHSSGSSLSLQPQLRVEQRRRL